MFLVLVKILATLSLLTTLVLGEEEPCDKLGHRCNVFGGSPYCCEDQICEGDRFLATCQYPCIPSGQTCNATDSQSTCCDGLSCSWSSNKCEQPCASEGNICNLYSRSSDCCFGLVCVGDSYTATCKKQCSPVGNACIRNPKSGSSSGCCTGLYCGWSSNLCEEIEQEYTTTKKIFKKLV